MSGAVLAPGTLFARDFRIVSPLGHGGMGTVYVAEQISTSKRRALKLMHPTLVSEEEHRDRFVREARVGARIASEHVVEVQAAGVDESTGLPYIAMELLDGETLDAYVKRRGFLQPSEVHTVFQQLCHAMIAAHAAGIVHRDLKPENVFLAISRRAGGPPFVVKVLDFGIAKLAAEAGTRGTTGAMGSPLWMSPEQTERGGITAAADVWALGLMAYFCLTGSVFWRAARDPQTTVAQVLREIVLEPIPAATIRANEVGLIDRLPPTFDRFFAQCVVREPASRFPDASAFWAAFGALFESLGVTMMALPPSSGMRPLPSRQPSVPPFTPHPVTPAPVTPAPMSPAQADALGTAPPLAHTMPRANANPWPWLFASFVVLVVVFGLVAGFVLTRAREKEAVAIPTITATQATQPTVVVESTAPTSLPAAPVTATAPTIAKTQQAAVTPQQAAPTATAAGTAAPMVTAPVVGAGRGKIGKWKVSGHTITIQSGTIVATGNVSVDVIREAIDWDNWEYGRCYERAFATGASMPHGTVTIHFKIFDQLPRNGGIVKSDFTNPAFNQCVLGTAIGQTANAAGSNGIADIASYPITFAVAD